MGGRVEGSSKQVLKFSVKRLWCWCYFPSGIVNGVTVYDTKVVHVIRLTRLKGAAFLQVVGANVIMNLC